MGDIFTFTICVLALIVVLIVCLRALNKNMKDLNIGFGWLTGFTFECSFHEPKTENQ